MGRSISQKTHERIQRYEAEGRRCCMGSCTSRAMWAMKSKAVDLDAAGCVKFPETAAKPAQYMGYCKKHYYAEIAGIEAHGTCLWFGACWSLWMVRVELDGGEVQLGFYEKSTGCRLENGDRIEKDGEITSSAKAFARAMRRDLEG